MPKRPSHDPAYTVLDLNSILADMLIVAERARDESRQWPNSFGHGYNVGRIATLQAVIAEII